MSFPILNSILLIDDDEISNLFNKIFIGKLDLDVEVEFALNGLDALEFLKNRRADTNKAKLIPNLLFLDVRMPTMNGWQFLDAYDNFFDKKTKSEIVIVMLTTSEDEGDMIKAIKSPNIKEFIQKPLSEETFQKIITKYFNGEV